MKEILELALAHPDIRTLEVNDFSGLLSPAEVDIEKNSHLDDLTFNIQMEGIKQVENALEVFKRLETLGLSPQCRKISLKGFVQIMSGAIEHNHIRITDEELAQFHRDVDMAERIGDYSYLKQWVERVNGAILVPE